MFASQFDGNRGDLPVLPPLNWPPLPVDHPQPLEEELPRKKRKTLQQYFIESDSHPSFTSTRTPPVELPRLPSMLPDMNTTKITASPTGSSIAQPQPQLSPHYSTPKPGVVYSCVCGETFPSTQHLAVHCRWCAEHMQKTRGVQPGSKKRAPNIRKTRRGSNARKGCIEVRHFSNQDTLGDSDVTESDNPACHHATPKQPSSTSTSTTGLGGACTVSQKKPTYFLEPHHSFSPHPLSQKHTGASKSAIPVIIPRAVVLPEQLAQLPKVVVLDWIKDAEVEQKELEGVANVECLTLGSNDAVPDSVSDAVAPAITAEFLAKMKKSSVLICASVVHDNVDIEAAGQLGIPVVHIPDYCTEEVADSALCLILGLMRQTFYFAKCVENGQWPFLVHATELPATRIRGKTLGIIGLGRIGTALASRAKASGFNVLFFDPFLNDGIEKAVGVSRAECLEQLLRESDVVSINCTLTKQNYHLINSETIKYMKASAYLVNTAHGQLVEEAALVAALKSGSISGAALDVLDPEPYNDGHLSDVPNLILTPHTSHFSEESATERRMLAARAAKAAITGQALKNVVNLQFLSQK